MNEAQGPSDGLPHTAGDLLEAQSQPTILIDEQFNIVAANRRYAERYGLASTAEVVGRKCHEVSHHSAKPCYMHGEQCPHREVFRTGEPTEVTHRHLDREGRPEYVTIHAHPVRDAAGQLRWMSEGLCAHAHAEALRFEGVEMIGHSPAFTRTLRLLSQVADSELPVLITGETGTGKELAAQYLHRQSPRSRASFVPVDSNVLSDDLFASELFGHEKGAFTGAVATKRGLFEQADGGTLFLDEIGDITPSLQTKLLRVLETGTYRRVGATELRRACVRLLCATNRNLKQMVADGRFRADLYYRIARVHVELPALRERREDITDIAQRVLERQPRYRGRGDYINPDAMRRLMRHEWPGNVRELVNTMERAALLAGGDRIDRRHLPDDVLGTGDALQENLSCERTLEQALARFDGNRRLAAAWLGMSERTLYRRLREAGLVPADSPLPAPAIATDIGLSLSR